jgi:hydroxypyruvate isomerase
MTLRFSPNLSLLWAGLPLPERCERAAEAGFSAVELWWPGQPEAELLPELTAHLGLELAMLNFDAGDMAGGDRGLAADPARRDQLRANVPIALRIARACRCTRLNLLVGLCQYVGLEYRPRDGHPEDSFRWLDELGHPRGRKQRGSGS